jgi:MFS family permease
VLSLCTKYWQIILTQSILVGIGSGMCFIPGVTIVGTYFSTRRSTASGIAATGSGVGGIIYPIVLRELIDRVGLPWAIRTMAFIMLATLLVPIAIMKPRLPPRKAGPLINVEALKDPPFALWLFSVFLTFVGLYFPPYYVEKFAIGIGLGPDLAFYMLIIINGASILGRVPPAILADRIGNLAVIIPSIIFSGVFILTWLAVSTQASLIAMATFIGFLNGAIQAVVPSTVAFLCTDLSKLGTNIGMTLLAAGLGMLLGTPISGAILDKQSSTSKADFSGAVTFCGVVVVLAGLLLCVCRIFKVGFTLQKA